MKGKQQNVYGMEKQKQGGNEVMAVSCRVNLASFPGSSAPERELYTRGEPGIFFLRKHDIIKIGLKQKGNVLRIVQRTMRSTLSVYDIQLPITRYM